MRKLTVLTVLLCIVMGQGCVSTAIDATTNAAVSVVKAPFKIAGAAVGAVAGVFASDEEEES